MPDREGGFTPDDEGENIVGKPSSRGEGWKQRRREAREEDVTGIFPVSSETSTFGHNALASWRFSQKRGPRWELTQNNSRLSEAFIDQLIQGSVKELPKKINKVTADLAAIAKQSPYVALGFFRESLLNASEIARMQKELEIAPMDEHDLNAQVEEINKDNSPESKLLKAIFGSGSRRKEHIQADYLAEKAVDLFRGGSVKISPEYLFSLLERHEGMINEMQRMLEPKMEKEYKSAVKLFFRAIEEKKIAVSKALFRERMSTVRFRIIDPMSAELEDVGGDYRAETNTIRVSASAPYERVKHILIHEMFHAISGQMELREAPIVSPEYGFFQHLKVGARLTKVYEDKEDMPYTSERFRWLNEALTEKATMEIDGKRDSDSYTRERELLALLIDNGCSEELLFRAYFENYEKRKRKGHHLPDTRELFRQTNELFGQGFLIKLDEYIARKGVVKAVEKWKELGDKFPDFVLTSADL